MQDHRSIAEVSDVVRIGADKVVNVHGLEGANGFGVASRGGGKLRDVPVFAAQITRLACLGVVRITGRGFGTSEAVSRQ